MDPSTSSSSSSFSLLCILIIFFVFPNLIPHEGAKQYVMKVKGSHGGSSTSSDFTMSDLSDS